MLSITLLYALFTILGVGSALNPILQKCDVKQKVTDDEQSDLIPGSQQQEKKKCCMNFKKFLISIDQSILSPIFTIPKSQQKASGSGQKSKPQITNHH